MTDPLDPSLPKPDKSNDNLVVLDRYGDPVRQGTLMTERESYERVIEGLKIMADSAAHLAAHEPENRANWFKRTGTLDQVRKWAVKKARIEDPIRQKDTEKVRRNPLPWRIARERFRAGCRQAAGGMRQLGVCFRSDASWARCAAEIEKMEQAIMIRASSTRLRRQLILPPGYH